MALSQGHCCNIAVTLVIRGRWLCFKHVDNLGACSIPSETGLLISCDYINIKVQSSNRAANAASYGYLVFTTAGIAQVPSIAAGRGE